MPHFDAETLDAAIDFVVTEVAAVCAGEPSDVTAVHDVGGGGLAVALAEMVAVNGFGADVVELEGHGELFSEFPGRFVMATIDLAAFSARAELAGVPVAHLGRGRRRRPAHRIDGERRGRGDLLATQRSARGVARRGRLARGLELVEDLVGHAQVAGRCRTE